jgi:endonuclease/exonuclease/phosphatase family metal-dependent hydrolase
MKTINLTDVGALRNELAKYKKGKKLDIRQFNQAARLAWLGRIVLSPLDPEDSENRAWLLYVERPEGLAARCLVIDEELFQNIHILDAEQGTHLAAILAESVESRARELQALNQRDFYFEKYFKKSEE